ncbi:subclass B1 metallo-beta-lactamase [Aquirufa sp. ROCK2-A2]
MKHLFFTFFIFGFFIVHAGPRNYSSPVKKPKIVFQSAELTIEQISPNAFIHVSYLKTNDFGNVPCNGLIVRDKNEVVIFDTPTNDKSAEALIQWVSKSLHAKIKAIVPTHFHGDCLGGLEAFHAQNIPSYASEKTISLAKENDYIIPQNGFSDSLSIQVGQEHVMISFVGEGHTKDNVVAYFPKEEVLFGGCLIKEMNATKGYLGDANVEQWPLTVQKLKKKYPQIKWVVPGHGQWGDQQLLDYTIQMFSK